jgi:hypothetical protein
VQKARLWVFFMQSSAFLVDSLLVCRCAGSQRAIPKPQSDTPCRAELCALPLGADKKARCFGGSVQMLCFVYKNVLF